MGGEEGQARDLRIARLAEETRPALPLPVRPRRTTPETLAFAGVIGVQMLVSLGAMFWFSKNWQLMLMALGAVTSASVAGLIVVVRQHRRLIRLVKTHRGLICPRCRYPIDTLPASVDRCPECGTAADRLEIVRVWRRLYGISRADAPDPL